MKIRFSDQVITTILEQSIIYTCACPAQICKAINQQRALYNYQKSCLNANDTDKAVHQNIANTVIATHAQLEDCLEQVLILQGWNMQTYKMPDTLAKKLLNNFETYLDDAKK